jgi:hypothetical protein
MQSIGSRQAVAVAAILALLSALWLAPSAGAAPPEFVLQMPEGQTPPGSGAAELDFPSEIAGNPETGHVYIAELSNARISEYTAWGLFVRAWGWGVASGADALQSCGPAQPEGEPPAGLCQAGKEGSGEGQFKRPFGVAVDSAGDVYVFDSENLRVQKFSEEGDFLLMFGGKVNQTKVGEGAPTAQQNVCPVDLGDVCQAGTSGEAASHFGSASLSNNLAYSPTANTIVVGDKDRIQIFEPNGTFKEEIPFEGELAAFAGKSVNGLDVDATGNIYFSLSSVEDVYKLSAAGVPLDPGKPAASKFQVGNPQAVAVDVSGNVYAINGSNRVIEFDAAGNRLVPTAAEEANNEFFPYIPFQGPQLLGLGTNICPGSEAPGNLYVSFATGFFGPPSEAGHVDAYGTAPAGCELPPPRAPEIVAQFASAVGREEATVRAQINPRFWQDATFYVEYGTGKCSEGGCGAKEPASEALLTSKSVNKALTSAGVVLEGLEPGTTYHYRFVAKSTGGGPVPVFGEDPDGKEKPQEASFEAGLERTFTTFAAQSVVTCANDAFRTAPSNNLPDCRAYEMVSPLEKGNADVALWKGRSGLLARLFELDQSAASGNAFAFTSATAFGDAEGAAFVTEYLARRGEGGWASGSISPPRTTPPVGAEALLSEEFQGFSEDLCMAWLRHYSVAPLAEGAIPGYPNLYRRENCSGAGSYQALTTEPPTNRPADEYRGVRWHGASRDGTHAIFTANAKLHPQAPSLGAFESLLYEHTPEGLRFVCFLPNGNPSPLPCAAGTGAGFSGTGNESSTRNAISTDGTRIFWSAASSAPGQIYARIEDPETGELKTIKVSGEAAGGTTDPAWYWTAANDGSKVIFAFTSGELKDELYEFDVESQTARLIAKGVLSPMGASEDASRIYFASGEDLDDEGPASNGARNLYFYEADEGGGEGSFTFIMALAVKDQHEGLTEPGPINELPVQRAARISPDGLHAVFVSMASPTPTGYDNLDAVSSEPVQEAYLYDAVEEELRCISCNPSGARPVGEDVGISSFHLFAAARIQGWEALGHAPRILSSDGTRAYFESFGALVPRDTNGTWDVYQWEEAGKGGCTAALDSFSPAAQGCIDLISSGDSPAESVFLDADSSGENVFFGTLSSLVKADYGLNDVYVARVGGGFPDPIQETECEGEACQSPPPAPPAVTPSSEAFEGPQNPRTKPKRKRCKAGARKVRRGGKVRCVKKKAKRQGKRRAAR